MFRADLHIHSRFSRATSSRLTLPHLAAWAGVKGIDVLATGDFTHPVWRQELRDNLEMDEESGLFRLKSALTGDDVRREIPHLAGLAPHEPKFMLEAEISSIYKKNGAVRKIHSLVYVPDFESADRLCEKLEAIGNLKSDGRPILGLDVKDLLAMVLDIPRAFMIPAHIWTPWFALFGSKSGFDSLEECFEDLTPHIFAAETGLSSDPDMNRCWSHLDHLLMVSSSDAHSGENLAREATLFEGPASYDGIFDALHQKEGETRYAGTLEFFPEEGKYHLDGHRACGVVLEPAECMKLNNICPVCGKPLTVGVLHRVLALADRSAPPCPGKDFQSLIPLPEILGEILHCGAKTRKVQEKYAELLERFGSEMHILQEVPENDLRRTWQELGEAVSRMRAGRVIRHAGYDGEYGVIRLFEEEENAPSLIERLPAARRRSTAKEHIRPAGKTEEKTGEQPRPEKKARRVVNLTVFLLRCGDCVALRRRPEKGVLAGLWEFPNMEGKLSESAVREHLKASGIRVLRLSRSICARHVFTHLEWEMGAWRIDCAEPHSAFRWVTRDALRGEIALPSAWKAFSRAVFSDPPSA